MNIKKTLLLLLATAFVSIAAAQIKIPNTKISFDFPSGGWKYLQTNKVSDNVVVYLYSYSADYVVDDSGDTVIPFMRIYVARNYDGNVYDLAYSRFLSQPFQSLDEYVYDDGSFGYLGAYTSEDDGKDYEFRMLYMKDQNNALEVRLETTRYNFEAFDEDFQAILKTFKASK